MVTTPNTLGRPPGLTRDTNGDIRRMNDYLFQLYKTLVLEKPAEEQPGEGPTVTERIDWLDSMVNQQQARIASLEAGLSSLADLVLDLANVVAETDLSSVAGRLWLLEVRMAGIHAVAIPEDHTAFENLRMALTELIARAGALPPE